MGRHRAPSTPRTSGRRRLASVGVLACAAVAATTLSATPALAAYGDPSICDGTSGNLVQNCGFEAGDFSSWTVVGDHRGVAHLPYYANSGEYGAYLGFEGTAGTVTQTVTVPTAGTYTFSYYRDSSGLTDEFSSRITDSNGATTVFESSAPEAVHDYERHAFSVSLPAGATTIQFALRDERAYDDLDDVVLALAAPAKKKTYSKISAYGKKPFTNGEQVTFYDYVTSDAYKKNTHPTGTVTFQLDDQAPVTKPLATAGVQSSQAYCVKKVGNGFHTLRATYTPGPDDALGDQPSTATYTFSVGSVATAS